MITSLLYPFRLALAALTWPNVRWFERGDADVALWDAEVEADA